MGMLVSLMDVSHQEMADQKIDLDKLNSVLPEVLAILDKVDFQPPRPLGLPTIPVRGSKGWHGAQDFHVAARNFSVLENGLGFALDFAEDVAVIRFPCKWETFCTNQEWHDAFKDCAKVIAASLGGTVVVHISDESGKTSECLAFIYESFVNRLDMSTILKILQRSVGSANSDSVRGNTFNNTEVLDGYFIDVLD